MPRIQNTAVLGCTILIVALTAFSAQATLRPTPLAAQSACGMFNGKPCKDECTRECTNGSCCAWAHYYYSTTAVLPGP